MKSLNKRSKMKKEKRLMKNFARLVRWPGIFLTMLALLVLVEGSAFAMRCSAYDPWGNCLGYRPDYPPGGHDCTGAPGSKEINIYTGPNKTGWCVTFAPATYMLLTPSNGWYNYFNVRGIEMGSSATGQVYNGPNWSGDISYLYSGQFYNYPNGPSGFQGLWNTTSP